MSLFAGEAIEKQNGNNNPQPLKSLPERIRQRYRIQNDNTRCILAEFICTALFVWTGTSVSAQTILSRGRNNEYFSYSFGWGFALLIATQLGFRISGSHLNPAVSLFFYTFGQISFTKCLYYWLAQFSGAFLGALLTFILYFDALNAFDGGERYTNGPLQTARIFATYPNDHLSILGGMIDQLFATAFFCLCVGLITDRRNRIPSHFQPSLIGFSLITVNIAFAFNSGAAVNPARDFSPRIFSMCCGYGFNVISYRSFKWFLIPLIIPFLGGFFGAWIYQLFIGVHIPSEIDELEEEVRRIQYDKTHGTHQTFNSNNSHKPPLPHSTFQTIPQQNQQDGKFIKVNTSSIPKKTLK